MNLQEDGSCGGDMVLQTSCMRSSVHRWWPFLLVHCKQSLLCVELCVRVRVSLQQGFFKARREGVMAAMMPLPITTPTQSLR